MAARKRQPIDRRMGAGGSWMAILASTTLGVDTAANTVHARVSIDRSDLDPEREYRLVVQSYDGAPGPDNRPVGSVQRAVTAAELRAGVNVDLLELRPAMLAQDATRRPTVVAWIESGKPDLEFDGRMARPRPGTASVVAHGDRVSITLDGTLAA